MINHVRTGLVALTLAFGLTGTASAYSIFERDDTNENDPDLSTHYGNVSGMCADGSGFTANYQTDADGTAYYSLDNFTGDSEESVIQKYCAKRGG